MLPQVVVAPDGCCLDADAALWVAEEARKNAREASLVTAWVGIPRAGRPLTRGRFLALLMRFLGALMAG